MTKDKFFLSAAAHCASERGFPVVAERLSVVLGKYNLYGGDVGSEEREVCRFSYQNVLCNLRCISLISEGVSKGFYMNFDSISNSSIITIITVSAIYIDRRMAATRVDS